jgi:hypothetical protein
MKQYAVIHVQKHSGRGGVALGRHIDRLHIPENADKSLSNNNMYCYLQDNTLHICRLTGAKLAPLQERVNKRIQDGYTGKTNIRKDAVKQLNIVLTGSHDQMLEIGRDPERRRAWITDNYRFLAKEYGSANIVGFAVHMDEATPHIHATVVPLTNDGRLSAKEVVGNKHDLKRLQDKYGNTMKKYGLERGEDNSNSHHIDTQDYYRSINMAVKSSELDISEAPTVDLPPAIIGREVYQQRLQTKITNFAAKIAKKLKEKEFRALSLKNENTTLKTLISAKKEGKGQSNSILPSRLSRLNSISKRKKGLSM